MDIEREVLDLYRCVVARDRLQEIHDGLVVSLTPAGPYVELESPYIQGFCASSRWASTPGSSTRSARGWWPCARARASPWATR